MSSSADPIGSGVADVGACICARFGEKPRYPPSVAVHWRCVPRPSRGVSRAMRRMRRCSSAGITTVRPGGDCRHHSCLPGVTVPAKQPFRPHNDQCIPPVEEPGQQYQSNSGDRVDSTRLEATLDVQSQLPSKEEILRFDRSTRSHRQSAPPERITTQGEEDSDGGEHDGIVSYDAQTITPRITILTTSIPGELLRIA